MRPPLAVLAACMLAACAEPPVNRSESGPPLSSLAQVDLDAYLGRWYEIARYENRFEKDCENVTAEYTLRDDGLIRVVNTCERDGGTDAAVGRAKIVEGSGGAKLKVSFFGPFFGDYWILDVADDYSWAVVGEPEGRYLWLLSRTPAMTERVLSDRLADLRYLGYDTDALHFTAQTPPPRQ